MAPTIENAAARPWFGARSWVLAKVSGSIIVPYQPDTSKPLAAIERQKHRQQNQNDQQHPGDAAPDGCVPVFPGARGFARARMNRRAFAFAERSKMRPRDSRIRTAGSGGFIFFSIFPVWLVHFFFSSPINKDSSRA